MAMRRAAARSGEWAQHFSNASCYFSLHLTRQQRPLHILQFLNFFISSSRLYSLPLPFPSLPSSFPSFLPSPTNSFSSLSFSSFCLLSSNSYFPFHSSLSSPPSSSFTFPSLQWVVEYRFSSRVFNFNFIYDLLCEYKFIHL